MRGILFGIGVGPGDAELLTIKAIKCMEASQSIILPAEPKEECYAYLTVKKVYPEIDKKDIICMPFSMSRDKSVLQDVHKKIYQDISSLLEQGKNVSFLTIGDPTIYSTYSYIHKQEIEKKYSPVIVSGVPSFCAAAAALQISLADNREQIHIIPASYEIEDTLSLCGTKIYMKSGKQLVSLKEMLIKNAEEKGALVYSIANCGMENEQMNIGAENINENGGYLTIVIVKEQNSSQSEHALVENLVINYSTDKSCNT